MTKLSVTIALLAALAGATLAVIPAPTVTYDPAIPDLRFSFDGLGSTPWPPVGARAWLVTVASASLAPQEYLAPNADRDFTIVLPARLSEGLYTLQADIVDGDGVALDSTGPFEWGWTKRYVGDLPRVAVGGAEAWDTGVSLSCHGTDWPVTVTWELYSEDGALVATDTVTIEPHASPAFNFAPYVTLPAGKAEPGIFTGSARFTAPEPVTMVYLCRPYAGGGVGFSLVQTMRLDD